MLSRFPTEFQCALNGEVIFFGLNKKILYLTSSHRVFYFEQTKMVHLTLDDPLFESAVHLQYTLHTFISYAVALSQELLFAGVAVSPLCVPAACVSHGGRKSTYIPASEPTGSNTHSSTGQRLKCWHRDVLSADDAVCPLLSLFVPSLQEIICGQCEHIISVFLFAVGL